MARQLTDEELQAQSTTLSPAGILTRPNEGAPALDAYIAQQNAEIAATRAGGQGDANHDGAGYLLDPATGQRATVGNQAAVLAAIAASRPAPVVARDSAADEWNAGFDARRRVEADQTASANASRMTSSQRREARADRDFALQREQFDFARHQAAVRDQFAERDADLKDATTYAELAAKKLSYQSDIKSQLDTGDFLGKAADIDMAGLNAEKQVAGLMAQHPNLSGPAVQNFLTNFYSARQSYHQANKAGGASEFEEGPARDTYNTIFRKTGDPAQARANAVNVTKSEAEIQKAFGNGLLTDDDLDPAKPGSLVNADATVDYQKAARLIAKREGEVAGLAVKSERTESDERRKIIANLKPQLGVKQTQDEKDLYTDTVTAELEYRRRKNGTSKAAETGGAPAAKVAGVRKLTKF